MNIGKAAITGKLPEVDPFKIYPLDPVSEEYVNRVLRAVPGYNEGTYIPMIIISTYQYDRWKSSLPLFLFLPCQVLKYV